jgi:hypothetical protein
MTASSTCGATITVTRPVAAVTIAVTTVVVVVVAMATKQLAVIIIAMGIIGLAGFDFVVPAHASYNLLGG